MDYLNDLIRLLLSCGPEALTVILVICLAYAPRFIPKIRNEYIPWLCIFVIGPVIYPLLSYSGAADPTLKNPIVWQVARGFVLGVGATWFHGAVVKRIEKRLLGWLAAKVPALNGLLSNGDTERIEAKGPDNIEKEPKP